ncbi:MAG TPA: hypothetical protein VGB55_12760 [Tepidisphaeraceae bacterium]
MSSTLTKDRVRAGDLIRYVGSPAVAGYIEQHRLYRSRAQSIISRRLSNALAS